MRDFSGDFETHVTVCGDHERLRAWAGRHSLKYTRIVLDRGQVPDQPMLTIRGRGALRTQRDDARMWTQRLRDEGFDVVRVKIEASPFNAGVPHTDEQAAALPPGCYFEHHIKLALPDEAAVANIRTISTGHAAHVSRNARRVLADGRAERFVTQRCRGIGRPEARQRLDALLDAIAAAGFAPVEVEEEFVIVDDNPNLDLGWIDE